MLDERDLERLIQINKHCIRIINKISNISLKEFKSNIDLYEIICFNIFQIGELAKGLSTNFVDSYNEIPWKEIKGMRDRIGHGYDTINLEIVYRTAVYDVNELSKYCLKLIKNRTT